MKHNGLQRINENDGIVMKPIDMLGIEHETKPIISKALERRRGLLDRLFPTPTDKEILRSHLALVKTHNDFSEKSLRAFCEVQLTAMSEVYRDYLVRGAAKMTGARGTYITQEKARLEDEISNIAEVYIRAMDERLEKLDTIKSLTLRQFEERRIYAAVEEFQEIIVKLNLDFRKVLELDVNGRKSCEIIKRQ